MVNISEIDNQHKKLVDLINELHDRMKQGKGKAIISSILSELANYTVKHFATEERLFQRYAYPETREHIQEHIKLVEQVKKSIDDFESGKTVLTMELMVFLKKWLTNHILKSDKKYSSFFLSKGVK